jgi:hypothetical protein
MLWQRFVITNLSDFIICHRLNILPYFNFQLAIKPGYPESLQQLIEMIKNPAALSASNAGKEDMAKQLRDNKVMRLTFQLHCCFMRLFLLVFCLRET